MVEMLCMCLCGICDYSLGVIGDPCIRSLWLGLSSGSKQFNPIVRMGAGACVGHTLRVPMTGTSVPFGEGSMIVWRRFWSGDTCDGCQSRTVAGEML